MLWKINKHFSYNLRAGGGVSVNDRNRWYGMTLTIGANDEGVLAVSNTDKSNYSIENILNYNVDLTKKIHLDATAGLTYDVHTFLNKNVKGVPVSLTSIYVRKVCIWLQLLNMTSRLRKIISYFLIWVV